MENNFKAATYVQVREEIIKMQNCGGAMIKPLVLYQIFDLMIVDEERTRMTKSRIRDIADTYCALCNEYYLIYCFDKHPQTKFYMSEERWAKYFLGQKARENSIKFLVEYEIIRCEKIRNPNKAINIIRTYEFDLDWLIKFRKAAEELYQKSKAKRKKI